MNMIKNWTNDELMFIRNFWREKSDKWMANKLGVPIVNNIIKIEKNEGK